MKMKVLYKAENADRREWIVDRGDPAWNVSYPVEKATDWGWLQFLERLDGMSPTAWRALVWALRKQDEHRLSLESVEITWTDIDILVLCPGCEEWVAPQGHECDYAAILAELPEEDAPTEDGPKKAKKSADPKS